MKDDAIPDPFYRQLQRAVDVTEKKYNCFVAVFYTLRGLQILVAFMITITSGMAVARQMNAERGEVPVASGQAATPVPAGEVKREGTASGAEDDKDSLYFWILVLGAVATALTAVDTLVQAEAKKGAYSMALFEFRAIRSDYVKEVILRSGNAILPDPRPAGGKAGSFPPGTKPRISKDDDEDDFMEKLFERYKKANSYGLNLGGADGKN